jgi:hypothetical protein
VGDPLTFRISINLPQSVRAGLEERAERTRTPLAVLLRAWIMQRYERELLHEAAVRDSVAHQRR